MAGVGNAEVSEAKLSWRRGSFVSRSKQSGRTQSQHTWAEFYRVIGSSLDNHFASITPAAQLRQRLSVRIVPRPAKTVSISTTALGR